MIRSGPVTMLLLSFFTFLTPRAAGSKVGLKRPIRRGVVHDERVTHSMRRDVEELLQGSVDKSQRQRWTAKSIQESPALPLTVGWSPSELVYVRSLFASSSPPPSWAAKARESLLRRAEKVKSLPSELRPGVGPGPWSPTQKNFTPPSNDKRDLMTTATYAWPCTLSCEVAGFASDRCTQWDENLRTFGPCDISTGKPWVMRDGFHNPAADADTQRLATMIEVFETLVLAWWFSPDIEVSTSYVETAMLVFRAWFLDEATRMNPRLLYAQGIPGHEDGNSRGLITATHRWGSHLTDLVALLQHAGPDVWTVDAEMRWLEWARDWLGWLDTSQFGSDVLLKRSNNHATNLFLHKLAFAKVTGNQAMALSLISKLRQGLPGSLVNQISVSGEMPLEASRSSGATYSRMNLNALFELGAVVQSICLEWPCSPVWNWTWQAPVVENNLMWRKIDGKKSKCGKYVGKGSIESLEACRESCLVDARCDLVNTRFKHDKFVECNFRECKGGALKEQNAGNSKNKWAIYVQSNIYWEHVDNGSQSLCGRWVGKGSTDSLDACKQSCINDAKCDLVNTRHKYGKFVECSFRQCAGGTLNENAASDAINKWDYHVQRQPAIAGSGAIQKALDYLLRYTPGGDREGYWTHYHAGTSEQDARKSWKDVAPVLRHAASIFVNPVYEARIMAVDDDYQTRLFNLLHPPKNP